MSVRTACCVLLPALLLGACTEPAPRLALGTLERDRVSLSATAAELIVAQPVAEGSAVAEGDLLIQLDSTLQQAAVATLEAELARLQALLQELQNGPRTEEIAAATARVDTARAVLQESERDLGRSNALIEGGVGIQAEKETLESRRASNAARLRDAEAQLRLLQAGTRSETLEQVRAQLASANAQLAAERQRLSNLAIVATRAGILDSLPWQVGERVSVGQPLAVILAAGAPYARVYIPEGDRAAINTGTTLVVHVDGSTESYSGTVRWIAQEPAFTPYYALNSSERSRLVWLAEVQLPDSAANLPAGLPAQVELP